MSEANRQGEFDCGSSQLLSAFRSASELRIQWMRLQGSSDSEIAESLRDEAPVSVEVEQEQLDAMIEIIKRNADRCRDGCIVDRAVREFADGIR